MTLDTKDFQKKFKGLGENLDNISIGLVIRDFAGDIKFHNNSFVQITLPSKEKSIVGKNLSDYFPRKKIVKANEILINKPDEIHKVEFDEIIEGKFQLTTNSYSLVEFGGEPFVQRLVNQKDVYFEFSSNAHDNFLKNIRQIRLFTNLSQNEMSEKFALSPRTYQRIEKGESQPSLQFVLSISAEYRIPISNLLENEFSEEDLSEFIKI